MSVNLQITPLPNNSKLKKSCITIQANIDELGEKFFGAYSTVIALCFNNTAIKLLMQGLPPSDVIVYSTRKMVVPAGYKLVQAPLDDQTLEGLLTTANPDKYLIYCTASKHLYFSTEFLEAVLLNVAAEATLNDIIQSIIDN